MMRARLLFLLVACSASCAWADDCVMLVCGAGAAGDACVVTPSQLVATMPRGFAITEIRGNTKVALRGDAGLAQCRPAPRLAGTVSLDQASLYGAVSVTGTLRVTGVLRFEPNDGGELAFAPAPALFAGTGKFFRSHFRSIKLDEAQPAPTIKVPANLAKANCWTAKATVELSAFSIVVGDTSAAGTYAGKARVTALRDVGECVWGGA